MATKTKSVHATRLPRSFNGLVAFMPPMAIKDDIQHANFVDVIDRLMQIEQLSQGQSDYLETLLELVEVYEARHHAIRASDLSGLQMLEHVMNHSGVNGSDIAGLLGIHPSMGSKILRGDRKLTWEHAKRLATHFKLAPAVFMD